MKFESKGNFNFYMKFMNGKSVHRLKFIGLLFGMQTGFTKFLYVICEGDSRAKGKHYELKEWSVRNALIPGAKRVKYQPSVQKHRILLPPPHIKLALIKETQTF